MNWYCWWKKEDKYVEKRDAGIVFYTKPTNEFIKPFKNNIVNRRLQTKRINTHTRK